jgi:hypothetical protein
MLLILAQEDERKLLARVNRNPLTDFISRVVFLPLSVLLANSMRKNQSNKI